MSSKKRDTRQYIVINEERLINEVQLRPILYDKALKGYRKPTIRELAWQEVATLLESTGIHPVSFPLSPSPYQNHNTMNDGYRRNISLSL